MKPKRYRALHITPGIVDYTDGDQRETVLIRKQALDQMNRSFLGKPVFNFTHKNIDPEKAFDFTSEEIEEHADGVVSDVGYDVESGYFFADMMIWDEETQKNIDEEGYKVSNAYIPEIGPSGIYNNVPYDEEVTGGEYYHMAIVDEPRYQDVKIFENSKRGKPMKFKLFGGGKEKAKENKADPPDPKQNMKDEPDKDKDEMEEMTMNMDSVLVDEEGNEIPVSEMVEAYKSMKKPDDEKPMINMEDTMEIDGKEVSMKELYDNYCAKKNAEPPTDEPLEDVVDESVKKNSKDGKEKPNAHFVKLKSNAAQGEEPAKPKINTERSRLKIGQARYGSAAIVAEGGA